MKRVPGHVIVADKRQLNAVKSKIIPMSVRPEIGKLAQSALNISSRPEGGHYRRTDQAWLYGVTHYEDLRLGSGMAK